MMSEARKAALRRLTLFIDSAGLVAATVVAFGLHQAVSGSLALREPADAQHYAVQLVLMLPLWLVLETLLGQHRLFEQLWRPRQLVLGQLQLHVFGFLCLSALLFLSRGVLNRSIVLALLGTNLAVSLTFRLAVTTWSRARWAKGARPQWLLVGRAGPALAQFAREASAEPGGPQVIGVLCDELDTGELRRLGAPGGIAQVIHDHPVDLVVLASPWLALEDAAPIIAPCERQGIPIAFAPALARPIVIRPSVMSAGGTHLVVYDDRAPRQAAMALKHAADVILAALGLLVLSPVLLAVSLAVLVKMGRPIFFAQERVGLHGRRFKLYKFRTMSIDAEARKAELMSRNEMSGPVFKLTEDPRVLPLGRFLRQWSLDELPQLFNVVIGDMSLVGPRPLPVAEQQEITSWYRRRLSVKPGITCTWQISGRSNIDFDQWMKLDLDYIDQWSLWSDLSILVRTIPAVLGRRGAK